MNKLVTSLLVIGGLLHINCAFAAVGGVVGSICTVMEQEEHCPGADRCTKTQAEFTCTCLMGEYNYFYAGCFCPSGQYGLPVSLTGCNDCPPPGTSTSGTNLLITDCYIKSKGTFKEETGSGVYDGNCPYSED